MVTKLVDPLEDEHKLVHIESEPETYGWLDMLCNTKLWYSETSRYSENPGAITCPKCLEKIHVLITRRIKNTPKKGLVFMSIDYGILEQYVLGDSLISRELRKPNYRTKKFIIKSK